MHHVYGPVPSRRLGRSLGIDPVPLKTCNFSCIYCQLGRTRPLVRRRKAFFGVSAILAEVATMLERLGTDSINWITFVGSGETTLNSRLGSLIRFVKSISNLPVAVITNGSLLYRSTVRKELMAADAVLPTLDAGSETLYSRIHRPHPDFPFDQHVQGLMDFRQQYTGSLWVEVMLLAGVNDAADAVEDIANILERVAPDEIHISTPTRPPTEPWVEIPSPDDLRRAASILGDVATVLDPVNVDVDARVDGTLLEAVLNVVSRHPLQEVEVVRALSRWAPERTLETLATLADSGKIRIIERYGKRFWCAADTQFPDHGEAATQRSQRHRHQETPGLST
jgi:wyosine [tRNA(Phe)-imidazoG37] synthetase (radical SAM superfamily)